MRHGAHPGYLGSVRHSYAGQIKDFLIDAAAFSGNSWEGPVVAPLPMYSGLVIGLVGIVYSIVLHREAAISAQTNEPRIMYEQNSGLAKVFPIDYAQSNAFRKTSETAYHPPCLTLLSELRTGVSEKGPVTDMSS